MGSHVDSSRDRPNENHLRRLLKDYFRYYHESRTHLSLNKDAPGCRPIQSNKSERRSFRFHRSVAFTIDTSDTLHKRLTIDELTVSIGHVVM
jgi:hypothetical protein